MGKHKNKIIIGVIIAIVLVFAFWHGGSLPAFREAKPEKNVSDIQNKKNTQQDLHDETVITADKVDSESKQENNANSVGYVGEKNNLSENIAKSTQLSEKNFDESIYTLQGNDDKNITESTQDESLLTSEAQDNDISKKELTCTLSIRCDTILRSIESLDKEKLDIVPKDGIIFKEREVIFYEGESVFDVLLREMKRSKIHMEFENTPIYNSAYIEGIANLYEFDCGELSGWMYRVNDWFPNYGCSRYQLKAGDKVEWIYTCDLGVDVGGNYSARNGR